MRRPVCSPRPQNVIDFARQFAAAGFVRPELFRRFVATLAIEAQRGSLDCGMGLCGNPMGRLAHAIGDVTCADCLELLQRNVRRHDATG